MSADGQGSSAGPHRWRRLPLAARGMLWTVLAGLCFVAFTAVVRHLGSDMDPIQAAFIRYVFGLILLAPILARLPRHRMMKARFGLHALRGLVHGAAVILWFFAMTRIPIAEVTALGFTSPVFATLGAALFLSEKLYAPRIAAVCFGFAGAMVILRPGVAAVDLGALAMLVAAPMFAGSKLLAKALTRTETGPEIVAYLSVFVTLMLAVPALYVWRTPTAPELFWLAMTAVLATASHMFLVQAYRLVDLSVTQPIEFLQLFWATLLGLWLFAEVPDVWTWVGAAIIVASATYLARRETRERRDAAITEV